MTTHHLRNLMSDNEMREPGVEPGCPKAPDPKSSAPPTEKPNNGRVVRPEPPRAATFRLGSVTESVSYVCRWLARAFAAPQLPAVYIPAEPSAAPSCSTTLSAWRAC